MEVREYLVRNSGPHDKWEIGHPAAMSNAGFYCPECGGHGYDMSKKKCEECGGFQRINSADARICLAWFRRDATLICFDYEKPEVKELPE